MAPLFLTTGTLRGCLGLPRPPGRAQSRWEPLGGLSPAPAPDARPACLRPQSVCPPSVRLCVWAGLLQPLGALVLGLGEEGTRASTLKGSGSGSGWWAGGWMGLEDIKETQKLSVGAPPSHSVRGRDAGLCLGLEPAGNRAGRGSACPRVWRSLPPPKNFSAQG